MKKLLFYCLLIVTLYSCKKEPLTDFYFLSEVTKVEEIDKYTLKDRLKQEMSSTLIAALPNKKLKVVRITYWTKDPRGEEILASGAIFYPVADMDFTRAGTILGVHYTYGANWEVPSEKGAVTEALFSLFGYVVVAPDYVGYGASKKLVHPYYDVGTTGQASADMMLAAKEYFASISRTLPHKLTILGYSQGGQATLATLKFIETQPDYQDAFVIDQVFAGGGAYDLISSYDDFVQKNYSSQPVTIPLLMLGLDYGDSLHLSFDSLFQEPLLSKYNEWINSKNYTTDQVTAMMGTTKLTDIMAKPAFDTTCANTKKFRASLRRNSLTIKGQIYDGWVPKAKMTLLAANEDDIVPYVNTVSAYNAFKNAGCNVTLHTIISNSHKKAGNSFYAYCMQKLEIY